MSFNPHFERGPALMALYLDPTSGAVMAAAPPGANRPLPGGPDVGMTEYVVPLAVWEATIRPALIAAGEAGSLLVVAQDGTYALTTITDPAVAGPYVASAQRAQVVRLMRAHADPVMRALAEVVNRLP